MIDEFYPIKELYIKGFLEIIKGETTSSRPATLNEAVRMKHALMEQKIHAKNERIAKGIKRKWENNNQEKDEKSSKNGQNRAQNGKAWKSQSQVKAKKSTKEKSKVKPEAVTEEMLNGPT
ncbi:hypothetical protein Tco_1446209 [Tanacetum coccineum]